MSFEVELKYRDVDHDRLTRALKSLGAEEISSVDQEDAYLNHPSRDFAETHEAFRIRRVGDDNRVTFKGPREAGPTKTREEIEIPFASGPERYEELSRLYDRLGFRRVAVVRKRRTTFRLRFEDHDLEIVLDRAEGLGDFAEVEAVAQGREELPRAQQAVLNLAAKLDLQVVEPRSYLRMYMEERSRESS